MSQVYNSSSIQILEGLEAVRKRPGMYIGSSDNKGLHHLVWEILDNAIDEVLNGYGNEINLVITKDNYIIISDNGRGVPIDMHSSGKPAIEIIYTVLHAGGKFGQAGGYKTSGGLHGVGASVVNALSKEMIVTSSRDGAMHQIIFENGGQLKQPLTFVKNTNKTGTTVKFLADDTIFDDIHYSFYTISNRLKESAYLLQGVKITIHDEKTGKKEEYCYQDGLAAFMESLNHDQKPLHPAIIFHGQNNDIDIHVALQYVEDYNENVISFVNLVKTKDGGSHEVGLRASITKSINDFARKNNILKDRDKNFEGSDVREGLSAIIFVSIPESLLEFEGQTKSKLGTPIAKTAVEQFVYERLFFYFEENRDFINNLIKKIQKAQQARLAARKARELARSGKKGKKDEAELSGKLANAQTKNSKINELFIVEGDSAGGSAKQGRDSAFQAILPLRGKVLNVEKAKMEQIVKNVELNTLIHCIGAGAGSEFLIDDVKYNKIIIMTDADNDGAHIQVLLLTFFYRYMRDLIASGRVYLAQPPLYRISNKHESHYCYNEKQLKQYRQKMTNYELTRYKGLGEMNASQLWETTMNPKTRVLYQVSIEDVSIASEMISTLMGDDANSRKEWINENVDFDGLDE